jgi:hypothetical protein
MNRNTYGNVNIGDLVEGDFFNIYLDAELESELNKEFVSERLNEAFRDNIGVKLSIDASLKKEEDNKWQLIDGEKIYIFEKEGVKLNIYEKIALIGRNYNNSSSTISNFPTFNEVISAQADYFIWVHENPTEPKKIIFELFSASSKNQLICENLEKDSLKNIKNKIEEALNTIKNIISSDLGQDTMPCDVCDATKRSLKYQISDSRDNLIAAGEDMEKRLSLQHILLKKYLFRWDYITETDREEFLMFLRENFDFDRGRDIRIDKSNEGNTLNIYRDNENTAEIIIDKTKKKAILKIIDGKTFNLKVKMKNNKPYVYKEKSIWVLCDSEEFFHLWEWLYWASPKFSWDLTENDKNKLKMFLREDFDINWVDDVIIHKSDDDKIIDIRKDDNSAQIIMDETGDRATLRINGDITNDLEVKKINGKLNIYNSSKDGFFWSDIFFINRVHKGYTFKENMTKIPNKESVILLDGGHYANKQKDYLSSKLNQLSEIHLNNHHFWFLLDGLKNKRKRKQNRGVFDFIHVAADEMRNKQCLNSVNHKVSSANFVFLNICSCINPLSTFELQESFMRLSHNKEKIPWIGTGFEIDGLFAYLFARDFYELFLGKGKNMADAFMGAKDELNAHSGELFLFDDLLGPIYAICCHPFTEIDKP